MEEQIQPQTQMNQLEKTNEDHSQLLLQLFINAGLRIDEEMLIRQRYVDELSIAKLSEKYNMPQAQIKAYIDGAIDKIRLTLVQVQELIKKEGT